MNTCKQGTTPCYHGESRTWATPWNTLEIQTLMPGEGANGGVIPMDFPPDHETNSKARFNHQSSEWEMFQPLGSLGLCSPSLGFTFLLPPLFLLPLLVLPFPSPISLPQISCLSLNWSFSQPFFAWERNKRLYTRALGSFLHSKQQQFPQNGFLFSPKSQLNLLHGGRQIHPRSRHSAQMHPAGSIRASLGKPQPNTAPLLKCASYSASKALGTDLGATNVTAATESFANIWWYGPSPTGTTI